MAVARHTSVAASRAYQRVDGVSKGNRLSALGLLEDTGSVPVKPPVESVLKFSQEDTKPSTVESVLKSSQEDTKPPAQEYSDSEDEFLNFRVKRRKKESTCSVVSSAMVSGTDKKKYSMTQSMDRNLLRY